MFRVGNPNDMGRLAADGFATLIAATLEGTAPLRHDVVRTEWARGDDGRYVRYVPTTPLEIAAHFIKGLPGVGPYMDFPEIFGAFFAHADATLFPIAGEWRPVQVEMRGVQTWRPQFDEWTASGTFAIHPERWTADGFRERLERAGAGRFRVVGWDARPLAARRVS